MKRLLLGLPLLLLPVSGCQDMWRQPKYRPLEPSNLFADGASARPPVAGTIPLEVSSVSPPALSSRDLVERGRERFNIYCSPCHGFDGHGSGMVVHRGFPSPPAFAIARLRSAPDSHYFDVITNGYGAMYSYADRVKPADRWAIIAYIRHLQSVDPTSPSTRDASLGTLEVKP